MGATFPVRLVARILLRLFPSGEQITAMEAVAVTKVGDDDPEHLKILQQLDQVYWYKSGDDYARWAAETLKGERATIERVGLLVK